MTDPIILAHRGLTAAAPENTLAAFQVALEQGFGLETDLQVTVDQETVVIHDYTVERTSDGQGAVKELTLAQIRQFDAGSWFNPRFQQERIPTLAELLQVVASAPTPTLVAVEFKAVSPDMVIQVCAQVAQQDLFQQMVGIGLVFLDAELRRQIKAIEPRFPTSCLADKAVDWAAALQDESADWIYTRFVPNPVQVAQAHDSGKRVLVSAAPVMYHHPDNWLLARDAGADALITDFPEACQTLFAG